MEGLLLTYRGPILENHYRQLAVNRALKVICLSGCKNNICHLIF